MKKWLRISICLILLVLGIVGYLFLTNIDFINNNIDAGAYVDSDQIEYVNWTKTEQGYLSQIDPQIVLNGINGYIDHLEIEVIVDGSISPKVYYTNKYGEKFSEDKSFYPDFNQINGYVNFKIDRSVCGIRIDFKEDAGLHVSNIRVKRYPKPFVINPLHLFCFIFFECCLLTPIYFSFKRFKGLFAHIGTFNKYSYLLSNLVKKDITTKYRRSILGILWSILNPFLMMLVITAVFQKLFRFKVENFPIYYLTGSLVFNFVSEATSGAMISIVSAGPLIRKVYIPKYIFPLQKCLFSFINMLFSFVAVLIMLVILKVKITFSIFLFFIPLLYALVFSIGFGMILACLNVFFRDTSHLYSVWITAWMYLTPIIYPIDILPTSVLNIVKLNPIYYYVDYFRQIVMYGTLPGIEENLICLFFSFAFLLVGLLLFKKKQDLFILFI